MDQVPCPDGYLLDAGSPLADGHHALNTYLVRHEEAGWKTATRELNALRGKPLKLRIWKALLERLEWLRAHGPDNPCFGPLRDLAYSIEKWKLELTEADLLEILAATARLAGHANSYAPMPHLMEYVAEHGLTRELSAAIRDYGARIAAEGVYVNQVSLQLFNSRLDMLAWRDEWDEIDLKRCWSQQIRADYRALQGAEREPWRRLLYSIEGDEGTRPAPKWLESAEAQIQAIGRPAFRARLLRWLEPLRPGSKQPLSREGSFLLRSFIWLARSLNDPELTARVAAIAEVQFKPKKNGEKVVRAAAEAAGQDSPAAPPPQPLPGFHAILGQAMARALSTKSSSSVLNEIADRVRVEGEVAHVRGQLDTYRVNLSTGVILRERDGRRIQVDMEAAQLPRIGAQAGAADVITQIFILVDDAQHAHALRTTTE